MVEQTMCLCCGSGDLHRVQDWIICRDCDCEWRTSRLHKRHIMRILPDPCDEREPVGVTLRKELEQKTIGKQQLVDMLLKCQSGEWSCRCTADEILKYVNS